MADDDVVAIRRKRLKQWIEEKHGGLQSGFVAKTGINQGELSGLLREKSFGEKRARALEAVAGMPRLYLDSLNMVSAIAAQQDATAPYRVSSDKYVTVQKLENELGLGYTELSEFDEVDGRHAFRRDWIEKNGWNVADLRVLDARGESQKPYINDGDVVLVNVAKKRIVDGEYYALRTEDGATIKRCFRQMDGKIRLEALNAPVDYLTPDRPGEIMGLIVYRAG